MLSESFALNKKEFEQIFTYDEAVFVMWDSDNNGKIRLLFEFWLGLIDIIEFFCALAIFSNSRVEDKIRCMNSFLIRLVLFEFFDFNENNYLEEVELQFLFQSCI